MKYRNKINGTIISIPSELNSPDWEKLGGADKVVTENGREVRKPGRHNSARKKADSRAADGSGSAD